MEAKLEADIKCMAKPFVKWAGGKGQLLDTFTQYYPIELSYGSIKRYIEPFVGGGAVLFHIMQMYEIDEAFIFDVNIDLINTYKVIKHRVYDLIDTLIKLEKAFINADEEERNKIYYDTRDKYNSCIINDISYDINKAAYFIFLNRTCFNGLYRVNKTGAFNVPMGSYKNPKICDYENLLAVSSILQSVNIFSGDYKNSDKYVNKNSFMYLDPPYRPLNISSSFTSYSKFGFDDTEQECLCEFYKDMDKKGAKLMLSNSDPKNEDPNDDYFDNLYKKYNIYRIKAKRNINSKGNGRGFISEILVTNY